MQSPRDEGQCLTQEEFSCTMKEGVVLPTEPHNHGSSDLLLSSIKQVYYRQAQGPTKPCQALSRQTALSAPILECCYTVAPFHMRLQRSVLFSKVLSCLCCSYLFLTNWPGDSGQENSLLLLENRGFFPLPQNKKKKKKKFQELQTEHVAENNSKLKREILFIFPK